MREITLEPLGGRHLDDVRKLVPDPDPDRDAQGGAA